MSQPAANRPTAGALGAKTARACDSCLVRRARWYCAADDAFLCQPCDNSVHSANPLARRHERVRLKTASSSSSSACCFKPSPYGAGEDEPAPAWHHGCKRKARTPRGAGAKVLVEQKGDACGLFGRSDTIVPDLDLALLEDLNVMEEEEQLLYRVPILDPVLADLCSRRSPAHEARMAVQPRRDQPVQDLTGFLASPEASCIPDFELDVESLLGRGGDDAFSMEELGLVGECLESVPMVKKEEEEDRDNCALLDRELKVDVDTCLESIDICFDVAGTPEDEKPMIQGERRKKRRRIMLDLNYDGVISAWDNLSSPWIDGTRPQFDPDVLSPDYMWGGGGEVAPMTHHAACTGGRDGGREARVSRYREKRRTRLFSKKIRYEVRKLNAEKRPRMKGRFVKRTSLLSSNGHGVIGQPQYVC